MPESPEVLRARARLAILTRHRKAKDPELIEAKRDYQVTMLRDHVRRVVDGMPPPTPEQIAGIRQLMGPGSPAAETVAQNKQEISA